MPGNAVDIVGKFARDAGTLDQAYVWRPQGPHCGNCNGDVMRQVDMSDTSLSASYETDGFGRPLQATGPLAKSKVLACLWVIQILIPTNSCLPGGYGLPTDDVAVYTSDNKSTMLSIVQPKVKADSVVIVYRKNQTENPLRYSYYNAFKAPFEFLPKSAIIVDSRECVIFVGDYYYLTGITDDTLLVSVYTFEGNLVSKFSAKQLLSANQILLGKNSIMQYEELFSKVTYLPDVGLELTIGQFELRSPAKPTFLLKNISNEKLFPTSKR